MRSDQSALQRPPATQTTNPRAAPPVSAPLDPARSRGRRLVVGLVALGLATVSLSACGRTAPIDALSDIGADPDIAGVSVTSPDAVVGTTPTIEGETTTSMTLLAPQQILYTVQPGDTLSGIAGTYNVTIQNLADYNGISDVNDITPGLELAIPPTPAASAAEAEQPPAEAEQPPAEETAEP